MEHEELSNFHEHGFIFAGAILMSNRETKLECLQRKLFGLPYSMLKFVKQIKAGMILFLFEHEERKLYGVFEATSDGACNIMPDAFRSTGHSYPAQILFRRIWMCRPLFEDEFRSAIRENYFCPFKFHFGLSYKQVINLIKLFSLGKINIRQLKEPVIPNKILEEVEYSDRDEARLDVRGTYSECKSNQSNTIGKRELRWNSALCRIPIDIPLQHQGPERSRQHPIDDGLDVRGTYSECKSNESNTIGKRELGWNSALCRVPVDIPLQHQGPGRSRQHPVDDARKPNQADYYTREAQLSHPLHSNSDFKSNESNTKGKIELGWHSAFPRVPLDLPLQYQDHERSQADLCLLEAQVSHPLHPNPQNIHPKWENSSYHPHALFVGKQSTNTHGLDYTGTPGQPSSFTTNPDNLGILYPYLKDSESGMVESQEAAAFQSSGVVNKISPQTELSPKTCSPIAHQGELFGILDYIPLPLESEENFMYEEDQNYGLMALKHPLSTESFSFIPHTIKGTPNCLYSPDGKNVNEPKHYQLMKPHKCYKDVEGMQHSNSDLSRINVFSRLAPKQSTTLSLDQLLNILAERRECWSKNRVFKQSIGWDSNEQYGYTSLRGFHGRQNSGRYVGRNDRFQYDDCVKTQQCVSTAPSDAEPENEVALDESYMLPFYNFRRRNVNRKLEVEESCKRVDACGNEEVPAKVKRRKLLRPSFDGDEA